MNIERSEFIKKYLDWLEKRLSTILPENCPSYRMVEIARRQSMCEVGYLTKLIYDEKAEKFRTKPNPKQGGRDEGLNNQSRSGTTISTAELVEAGKTPQGSGQSARLV